MPDRVLVTGCAGFIGSHLVEALIDSGHEVVGVDSFAPTYETASRRQFIDNVSRRDGFGFIEGDLTEMDLAPLISDAATVYHLAARPGVRASWADFGTSVRTNIFALHRVLDALTKHPEVKLIFASSSSVYGVTTAYPTIEDTPLRPISPYGVTKASGEALINAYVSQFGLSAVSLRYFTVYGPRQRSDMAFHRWIKAILAGRPIQLYGDGSTIRDFTYVGDVVAATSAAADLVSEGHTICNVAGGSPATLREVIDLLEKLMDRPAIVNQTSPVKGDPDRTGGDTARIKEVLGWSPKSDLATGLRMQVESMMTHKNQP